MGLGWVWESAYLPDTLCDWSGQKGWQQWVFLRQCFQPYMRTYLGCFKKCRFLASVEAELFQCWIETQTSQVLLMPSALWEPLAWINKHRLKANTNTPGLGVYLSSYLVGSRIQEPPCWWQQLEEEGWIKASSRAAPEPPTPRVEIYNKSPPLANLIKWNCVRHRLCKIEANRKTTVFAPFLLFIFKFKIFIFN